MIYAPRQTHSHSFYPLLPVLPVLAVGPTPLGPLVWSSFFIILHVICVAFLIFSHLFFRGRGLANFCFSIDNQMRVKFASLACWGHKFINRLTSDLHQKICSFIYGSTFGGQNDGWQFYKLTESFYASLTFLYFICKFA